MVSTDRRDCQVGVRLSGAVSGGVLLLWPGAHPELLPGQVLRLLICLGGRGTGCRAKLSLEVSGEENRESVQIFSGREMSWGT